MWAVDQRPPAYHPDAITISPSATPSEVLAIIDSSPGCAVKDSFASLDLEPHGFRVLFDALWFVVDSVQARDEGDLAWEAVVDADDLVAWVGGWSGRYEDDPPFDVALIEEEGVTFLAARRGGEVVAGAIGNVGPGEVVGIRTCSRRARMSTRRGQGRFASSNGGGRGAPSLGTNMGLPSTPHTLMGQPRSGRYGSGRTADATRSARSSSQSISSSAKARLSR